MECTAAQLRLRRACHDRLRALRGREQALAIRAAFAADKDQFANVMALLYGK